MQRKYIREQEKQHGDKARIIQANVRIHMAKKTVNEARRKMLKVVEDAQRNQAACVIQANGRIYMAKMRLNLERRKMLKVVADAKRAAEEEKKREEDDSNGAATMLQRQMRGRDARKRVGKMKEEKENTLKNQFRKLCIT